VGKPAAKAFWCSSKGYAFLAIHSWLDVTV
jgi:hypothetical protein